MTRDEMLNKMGLTDAEHRDLMAKFTAFQNSLNANQKRVMSRSVVSLSQAAKSFGPNVTADDVQSNLIGPTGGSSVGGCHSATNASNQTNPSD